MICGVPCLKIELFRIKLFYFPVCIHDALKHLKKEQKHRNWPVMKSEICFSQVHNSPKHLLTTL